MLLSLINTRSQNGLAPASWFGLQEKQEPLAAFLINAPDFTPRILRITPTSNFLLFFLISMFFLPCVLTHLFYVYLLW